MKIALICDTHYGIRGDNPVFINNFKKFLDNVFFPYLDKHNIKTLIHLGDLVDRRKFLNIYTANRLRTDFLKPLRSRNITPYFIAGNHDVFYKNTNEVNIYSEHVRDGNVFIKNAETVTFDGLPILFIPWMTLDNQDQIMDAIRTTPAQIVMGHLEITGFEMNRGSISEHGMDKDTFGRFDAVYSGHFHHKSSRENIHYLGAHGEFTWADHDDPRGFHIFDTETRRIEFIQNPFNMFEKINYDDTSLQFDFQRYENTYVKVIVKSKTNAYQFDQFLAELEAANPVDVQIIETQISMDINTSVITESESTIDIFRKHIDEFDEKIVNKSKLQTIIVDLHQEALSL